MAKEKTLAVRMSDKDFSPILKVRTITGYKESDAVRFMLRFASIGMEIIANDRELSKIKYSENLTPLELMTEEQKEHFVGLMSDKLGAEQVQKLRSIKK